MLTRRANVYSRSGLVIYLTIDIVIFFEFFE